MRESYSRSSSSSTSARACVERPRRSECSTPRCKVRREASSTDRMGQRKLVGRVNRGDLLPGTCRRLPYPPFDVLLVNLGGVPYAIDDTCNHAGESLMKGELHGHEISCPAHGYVFDVRTGRLIEPLGLCDSQRTFEVTIEGAQFAVYDEILELVTPVLTGRRGHP